MREIFVSDLVKDILGPRGGPHEILDEKESPLSEYITGILAPASASFSAVFENIEAPGSADINTTEEDNTEGDADVQPPPLLHPALDPRNYPSSFGISFLVEGENPEIEVCLTWARYRFCEDRKKNKKFWKREPRYAYRVIKLMDNNQTVFIDSKGETVPHRDDAEISLHVITQQFRDCKTLQMVNLYMVNNLTVPDAEDVRKTEYYIFQPQIRVVCGKNTKIVSAEEQASEFSSAEDGDIDNFLEEKELAFLYRNRPVKARGFLCSAVWKDIDPLCPWNGNVKFNKTLKEPPFAWPDGEILPSHLRDKFLVPDVRSEFVPLYAIPSPDLDWPSRYGPPPELRADRLAETFDRERLKNLLKPLLDGYGKWIQQLQKEIENLPSSQKKIGERLISRCVTVFERMKKGLDILMKDDNARLAFCFANKAMDLQSRWIRKKPLEWRPFQLGYILTVLESLVSRTSDERDVCDLLWVPTGAGKTEAYLFLIAFIISFRRLKYGYRGAGVSVITRYTLRLLTIQQFRRLLALITACEYLRIDGLGKRPVVGWFPAECTLHYNGSGYLWGVVPFSAGLWVGGGVTPNRLGDIKLNDRRIYGALSILKDASRAARGEGEPAQIIHCPACGAILSVPSIGISGTQVLHLVIKTTTNKSRLAQHFQSCISKVFPSRYGSIELKNVHITPHSSADYFTVSLKLEIKGNALPSDIDNIWNNHIGKYMNMELVSARASRPGYFIRWYFTTGGQQRGYDFEIFCPSPDCPLKKPWCAGTPSGWVHGQRLPALSPSGGIPDIPDMPDRMRFVHVQNQFRLNGNPFISDRIPVPAFTVDEQVYHRLPSVVVATVDKFARPAFEPRSSSLFGNVDHYHCIWGYYRKGIPPLSSPSRDEHPSPAGNRGYLNYTEIGPFDPPDLIIQDELHLIEGPIGSLAGIYETAVDFLCSEPYTDEKKVKPKYIASTATIRNATDQIKSVFNRKVLLFPPPGLTIDDRFFIREKEIHTLDDSCPGRLYVGVCAPGKGALTPFIRICARLLQTAGNIKSTPGINIDPYWTLTCYFNSIRELSYARACYKDDIPARLRDIAKTEARSVSDYGIVELSRRVDSTDLPAILSSLMESYPNAIDVLLTTSMFGTGVDISRLSLMVVNGQPKTTSSYIQATGRVGRVYGGLVVTFFRASRPRDLSHYEFFCGYHRQLHRFVEPVTTYPFASGVLDKAIGPVSVFILRNMRDSTEWYREISAKDMARNRGSNEVLALPDIFENRAKSQPLLRQPPLNIRDFVNSELDRWQNIARISGTGLRYVEYQLYPFPRYDVVLGDSWHEYAGRGVIYKNAPQSLRDIEETCGFQT